jgi:transcription elongation factor Elf1
MKFIPNWKDKSLKCHFCGTTKSVKYVVELYGVEVCTCNRCVLKHDHTTEKGGEG